jgi:hypothetical protein
MSMSARLTGDELRARNRRVAWILLSIIGGLATAALLVGIRW